MFGWYIVGVVGLYCLCSLKIVRPTERGVVERFGKYSRFAMPGLNFVPLIVDRINYVNITEKMAQANPQQIITKDKLNASVDAQVYYKVKEDEESIKLSQYKVNDYEYQIVQLARTTLRDVIGNMTLADANSKRSDINTKLSDSLRDATKAWGIDIVRTELKEIDPPHDVQVSMNKVVMAENAKTAAVDFALAAETEADGRKKASIKEAEGLKEAEILKAQGHAEAFTKINESFKDQAVLHRQLEVAENVLSNNTKIIVPQGTNLVNVISEQAQNIVPVKLNQI